MRKQRMIALTRSNKRVLGLKVNTWITLLWLVALIAIVSALGRWMKLSEPTKIVSPLSMSPGIVFAQGSDFMPHGQFDYVRDEIVKVFGKDANKAFKLLSCENSTLDPQRVNTYGNTPEGSRDIGVFQINEFWQGVQGKFLFDYKINIQIAKDLFDENGGKFNLWTCGQRMGI